MKNYLDALIKIGITEKLDSNEARRVSYVNGVALLAMLYLVVRILLSLGNFSYCIKLFFAGLPTAFLYLNKYHYYKTAKICLFSFYCSAITFFSYFFLGGLKGGAHVVLFTLVPLPFMLFDLKQMRSIFLSLGFVISCFIALIVLHYIHPLAVKVDLSMDVVNISTIALTIILLLLITWYFCSSNNKAEEMLLAEKKKLEIMNQQIKKTNEELVMTQDIARLGTWVFDVETEQINWSKEVFRMAGLEGRTDPPSFDEYISLLHPDDVELLKEKLQKAINGEPYEVELRHQRPDGDYNYTLTRAKPTLRDGSVVKVQGTVVDLTNLKQVEMALKDEMQQRRQYEKDLKSEIEERKKAEQALRESEHQIRLITDNMPAYMAYVDTETMTYRFVNQMFLTAYGKKRDEIVGHHVKDIIGKSNYEYALPYIEEAIKGNSVSYINTFPLKQGTRWINVSYTPDFDENKKVKALFVLSVDISEKKQTEIEKERLINDLKKALVKVKTLSGLLPICSSCKKIRDDKGYWNQIESYIQKYSEAEFSHGMCPECSDKFYGDQDWYKEMKKKKGIE